MSNQKFKKATTTALVASLLINSAAPANAAEVARINQNRVNVFHAQPVLEETIGQVTSIKDIESKVSKVLNSSPNQVRPIIKNYEMEKSKNSLDLKLMETVATWDCGAEGSSVTASLDSSGVLTIAGSGDMATYSAISGNLPEWLGKDYKDIVDTVIIEDGVTSIGSCAFYESTLLAAVSIPASVKTIGDSAFFRCGNLNDVNIPEGVTSIENDAFRATGLQEISIPNSTKSIGHFAFSSCEELRCVVIGSGLTRLGTKAFANCRKLYSIGFKGTTEPNYGISPFVNIHKKVDNVYVPEGYSLNKFCDLKISKKSKITDIETCRERWLDKFNSFSDEMKPKIETASKSIEKANTAVTELKKTVDKVENKGDTLGGVGTALGSLGSILSVVLIILRCLGK